MFEALMIAATGLKNQQNRIDTIADNVANVNTDGFKSSRLDFKDALYTAGIVPAAPRTPEGNQQKGHGLMIATITKDFTTGSLRETGNPLDFSIVGEGLFELENLNGDTIYTRGGNFYVQPVDDKFFLVNSSGYFVHNNNGERIEVPQGTDSLAVSETGAIEFIGNGIEETSQFGIYTFRNIRGLISVGSGNYAESTSSGEKLPASKATMIQGYMESSNVNLAAEMTRLIRAQRAFSLAGRALTTADDMEGIANNLRR